MSQGEDVVSRDPDRSQSVNALLAEPARGEGELGRRIAERKERLESLKQMEDYTKRNIHNRVASSRSLQVRPGNKGDDGRVKDSRQASLLVPHVLLLIAAPFNQTCRRSLHRVGSISREDRMWKRCRRDPGRNPGSNPPGFLGRRRSGVEQCTEKHPSWR